MASADVLLAFAVATVLVAYLPGPALLYTAAQTLTRGRRAGLLAAFGIHLGGYIHVAAAAFGLSAIFRHVPEAYLAVKVVGALYLCWLGIGLIRRGPEQARLAEAPPAPGGLHRHPLLQSVVVEVLNPKVAMFFIAFVPQFVHPAASLPVWAQFLILGTAVNLTFTSADLLTVLAASHVARRVSERGGAMRALRWLGGSLLIGLGLRLAADRS